MKILMIIPAYNEEGSILSTVKTITEYKNYKLDYIVINDGSKDSTKDLLIKNNINFIDLINNSGIGAAVQTGYKYAFLNDYDIAIQYDGDGQHDIKYVDRLINTIEKGKYNVAIGSRFVGDESKFLSTTSRRLGIKMLSFFLYILTGAKIKDMTSGFRAVDKKVIELFAFNYDFEYPEPITNLKLLKKGFKLKEVPVSMNERKHGKSSITLYKSFYYMISVTLAMFVFGIGGSK